jgi:hypothetical protein
MRRTVVRSTLSFSPRLRANVGGARRLLGATSAAGDLEQRQLESFRIFNDHSGKFRVAVVNRYPTHLTLFFLFLKYYKI